MDVVVAASKSTTGSKSPARTSPSGCGGTPPATGEPLVRTYVLDTSVLLADAAALRRFEEHEVVLPVVVITELEG